MSTTIAFTEKDVQEFFEIYIDAFPNVTAYTRPIQNSWTEYGVRVSFNSNLEPFIGTRLGFNHEVNGERFPVHSKCKVISTAMEILDRHMHTTGPFLRGGRYFFSNDGIYRKDENGNPICIQRWQLTVSDNVKAFLDRHIFLKSQIEHFKNENKNLRLFQFKP
jgi:hypothetical protein